MRLLLVTEEVGTVV